MARLAPARKNSKIFLTGKGWRENKKKFLARASLVLPKCTNSCQNEPKCANSSPWQENVILIPRWGVPARKNCFFYSRNSRRTLPRLTTPPPKAVSRKKMLWLYFTQCNIFLFGRQHSLKIAIPA